MAKKKFTDNVVRADKMYCSWDDLEKILIEGTIFRKYSAVTHEANIIIDISVTIRLFLCDKKIQDNTM